MKNILNNGLEKYNNGNEQISKLHEKKIEIIETLNTPNYKDGIDFIFEENPKIINIIGSFLNNYKEKKIKEIYIEYLHTIFPNSKIKEIVYHGNRNNKKFNEFDFDKLGKSNHTKTEKEVEGIFFTPSLKEASETYSTYYSEKTNNQEKGTTYAVLINVQNPYFEIDGSKYQKGKKINNFDSTIYYEEINEEDTRGRILKKDKKNLGFTIFNKKDIHILGSDKDINKLTEWLIKKMNRGN